MLERQLLVWSSTRSLPSSSVRPIPRRSARKPGANGRGFYVTLRLEKHRLSRLLSLSNAKAALTPAPQAIHVVLDDRRGGRRGNKGLPPRLRQSARALPHSKAFW